MPLYFKTSNCYVPMGPAPRISVHTLVTVTLLPSIRSLRQVLLRHPHGASRARSPGPERGALSSLPTPCPCCVCPAGNKAGRTNGPRPAEASAALHTRLPAVRAPLLEAPPPGCPRTERHLLRWSALPPRLVCPHFPPPPQVAPASGSALGSGTYQRHRRLLCSREGGTQDPPTLPLLRAERRGGGLECGVTAKCEDTLLVRVHVFHPPFCGSCEGFPPIQSTPIVSAASVGL